MVKQKKLTKKKGLTGLVFLIFRNETKRALLPNEITTMDTVKALFVRSFPDGLSMDNLSSPWKKIYIMDPTTNVYYELDDLRDIKDRTVLKVYEREPIPEQTASPLMSPKRQPLHQLPPQQYYSSGHESDSSVRSAPPRSPVHATRFNAVGGAKALQSQANYVSLQELQQYGHLRYSAPPTQHRSPTHQPQPHPHPHPHRPTPTGGSNQNSPQRTLGVHQGPSGPQRHSVAYLPNPDAVNMNVPQSRSYSDYYDPGQRSGSVTPTMIDMEARTRMDKMEMEIANLAAMVQHQAKDGSRPASTTGSEASYSAKSRSTLDLPFQRSFDGGGLVYLQTPLYVETESDTSTPTIQSPVSHTESNSPTVSMPSGSPQVARAGMSDISSATPQPMISVDMQNSIRALNHKAKELKTECRSIRRQHIANQETMRDTINSTFKQIKDVLVVVPGANDQPLRSQRSNMDVHMNVYKDSATRVSKDLIDLESSVEDLRNDVLNKKCRVNVSEVEAMAMALSNISKTLGDLKGRFPELHEDIKAVMSGEMEVVVKEEKFLKEEPEKLDNALKRCKKLTGTLYTLKRLASVQEQKTPTQRVIEPIPDGEDPHKAVLANIEAMVPNHAARVQGVEACENARERKKKYTTQVESLRFEKSLEKAQKQLRETRNVEENEQRAEKVLSGLFRGQDNIEVTLKPDKSSHQNTMNFVSQNGHSTVQRKVSMGESEKPVAPTSPKIGQGPIRTLPQQQKICPLSPPAPKKPPRTMEYPNTPPMARSKNPTSEMVTVKSPTDGLSNGGFTNVQSNMSANQSNSFSTFSTPPTGKISPVSSPIVNNNNSVSSLQSLAGKNSMSQPNTSTPKSHVTFNPAVTEIKENGGQTDISKAKKIPPPPPPRRSSRLMSPSTVEPNSGERCFSPPTYENIEDLTGKATSPDEPVWVSQSSLQAKQATGKSPAENTNGKGQGSRIQKPRPLNKFQHDLAAGIYANMNRPDLQEQSTVAAEVVRNKDKTNGGASQSPSDSESSLDSQTGTVKRKPKNALSPNGTLQNSSETNKAGMDVKKVPPPPPVRKSSTLTTNESNKKNGGNPQEQYHKIQQLQRDHIYENPHEVKRKQAQSQGAPQKYGAKPQAQLPQTRNNVQMQHTGKVLTNGDVKKGVQPKATHVTATKPGNSNTAAGQHTINRRSEETEIF